MSRAISRTVLAAALLSLFAGTTFAQRALKVSGHVTSAGAPLVGAHVRIESLLIDRATDADGAYTFLVPSSSVHGQDVVIVATMADRRIRYLPKTATIHLTGEPVIQDFDLIVARGNEPVVEKVDSSRRRSADGPGVVVARQAMDVADAPGATDLPSVLVGRFVGLNVAPASVLGGSSRITYRGARSALGTNQPLFVVDGLPLSNTVFASAAQRFGLGGFDYGSPISDIDLANVASLRLLTAADATAAFGGRGANGVIAVNTLDGADGPFLAITASQQITSESYARLPSLQNQYGQGLNGKFEFFNGRGGGINDAVDQNWGPAIDGRPVAQASYVEAGRADVRLWTARPNNAQNYFDGGRTSNTTASIQARNDQASFRILLGDRTTTGITPRDRLERRNATVRVTFHPSSRLDLSLSGLGAETKNDNAPGSGFGEGNPVFQFMRMGRQVDTDSLRRHLRDATGKQISWSYTGHNNPFFMALADSNHSRRYHTAGSGSATFALSPWLSATATGGVDYTRDGRLFSIASGWMGGFPFYAGQGDFSKGGSEGDEISVQQNSATARLDAKRTGANGAKWTFGAGADLQSTNQRIRSAGIDSAANVPSAGAPDTARIPSAFSWDSHSSVNSVFGEAGVAFTNGASLQASVRNQWASFVPAQTATSILPSIRGAFDLGRAVPSLVDGGALSSVIVRAQWWMDAPELNPYTLETMYAGRAATGTVAPSGTGLLLPDANLGPEITNGFQLGTDIAFRRLGLGLGLTYYHERTSDVILPVASSATSSLVATNAGVISNQGVEARLSAELGDGAQGLGWSIAASAAKNTNQVDQLYGSASAVALGPSLWGLNVEARSGQPLGVLVGRRLLRQSGSLVLRNGLPLPDSASGLQVLGNGQPNWVVGLGSTLRYRWISLSSSMDAHVGGQVFSGTNLWGSYAGTLATTAFRPDSGLLIAGVDAVTGKANTQHVSTQDYYHALGAVQEPWIYSATFVKLREARLSVELPTGGVRLPFESVRASLIGRNLALWTKAPNIDPEAIFSPYQLSGVEMGQLPSTRSIGVQVTIVP